MRLSKTLAGVFLPLLPFLLFVAGCAVTKENSRPLTLITDDLKTLSASYFPPPSSLAPAVILLPDARCDKAIFQDLSLKLQKAGFAVLSVDFRYKDRIAKARSREEAINLITGEDLNSLVDYDPKSAIDFLLRQPGIDPRRMAIVGTSLGSRVALMSGVRYGAEALVLVSISGKEILPGNGTIKRYLDDFAPRPVLFMSAEDDWGGGFKAAEDNRIFHESYRGNKDLKIWPGPGHGSEILDREEASEYVLSWLRSHL